MDLKQSLTFRQMVRILVVSLCIAGVFYAGTAYYLIMVSRAQVEDLHEQLAASVIEPATTSVWTFDDALALKTLEGVAKIEFVSGGEMLLTDGETLAYLRSSQPKVARDSWFSWAFVGQGRSELPLVRDGEAAVLGKLVLHFDLDFHGEQLAKLLWLGFWDSLFRVLFLSMVLALVFHRFTTRAILRLGEQVATISPENPKFSLLEAPKGHEDDEIGLLTDQFNATLTRLSLLQQELMELATRDALTGLPNRALMKEELERASELALLQERRFAVLFMDLDRFKDVNDSLGHSIGDEFLSHIGHVIEDEVSNEGIACRIGGDEFVVIAERCATADSAATLAERIIHRLATPVQLEGYQLHPALSIGIVMFPDDGTNYDELLRNADAAMYSSKRAGSNKWAFFESDMTDQAMARLKLEGSLRDAVAQEAFELFLQPKVGLQRREPVGAEGLIRWLHKGKMVSPAEFIPVCEETGLIIPLGYWVIEQGCAIVKRWESRGWNHMKLSVNLSPRQLLDDGFIDRVRSIVERFDVTPGMLELEVTETSIMENIENQIIIFEELRSLGLGLSIDDFGTGYSSLAYLQRLSLDTLKIDISFVRNLPNETTLPEIIIVLAKALDLYTVAEGVETEEQREWLAHHGCDCLQGYLESKPLPEAEFDQWIAAFNPVSKTAE